MVGWSSIWEQWIGNKRSSIIKGKKKSRKIAKKGGGGVHDKNRAKYRDLWRDVAAPKGNRCEKYVLRFLEVCSDL